MGDYQLTKFQTTVPMSTYLVAFIIANYSCINETALAGTNKNTTVGVCGKPLIKDQLRYALNISKTILEFFESVYNVKYPLPKLGELLFIIYYYLIIQI